MSNLIKQLTALRSCLLHSLLAILIVFLALFYFASDLFNLLALPLLNHLPASNTLIATQVAAPLLIPLKFTLMLSVFIVIPYILWQLWRFIAPGLYQREKQAVWLLVFSTGLFYLGMMFAYYIVFPLVFSFFIRMAPPGVTVMPDIGEYLGFTLKLFFAFGSAFEVPIVVILLVWSGLTRLQTLTKQRPYIIVLAFTFGMLLTPPDVISQILLAVPLYLLFELGIVLTRIMQIDKKPLS